MTPVINPWIFYAASIADELKIITIIGIICAIVAIVTVSILALCEFENQAEVTDKYKKYIKIAKRSVVILAIFITFYPLFLLIYILGLQ